MASPSGNPPPSGPQPPLARPANGAPQPPSSQMQPQSQSQHQPQPQPPTQQLQQQQQQQQQPLTNAMNPTTTNGSPLGPTPFALNPPPQLASNMSSNPNLSGNPNAEAGPGPRTAGQGPATAGPSGQSTITPAQKREEERRKEIEERKRKEREEVLVKKDKSLGEMLVMLEDYQPLIPDEVTDYYLQRSGFECDDPRIKRLLSLAAQKFVNDIASDAFHYAKLRMNAPSAKTGKAGSKGNEKDKGKVVLTMDDLSNALGEHGVNARKPDYYF